MKRSYYTAISFFLVFLISGSLSAQKKRYIDFLEEGEKIINGNYQYVITKHPDGRFIYRCFFPEKMLLIDVIDYADEKMTTTEGRRLRWFDNGHRSVESTYRGGFLHGAYREYSFETDSLMVEGNYFNGEKIGAWRSYHTSGALSKEEFYEDGLREGAYMYYDTLGAITESGVMAADTVQILSVGKMPVMGLIERMPQFPGCETIEDAKERKRCADREMLEYVYGNIKYPSRARNRGVEGMAMADFVVEKDGRVTNVRVLHGLNEDISKEVERIMKGMPVWHPGYEQGKPVRVKFNLPVKFKL
jgi:TonB family protein